MPLPAALRRFWCASAALERAWRQPRASGRAGDGRTPWRRRGVGPATEPSLAAVTWPPFRATHSGILPFLNIGLGVYFVRGCVAGNAGHDVRAPADLFKQAWRLPRKNGAFFRVPLPTLRTCMPFRLCIAHHALPLSASRLMLPAQPAAFYPSAKRLGRNGCLAVYAAAVANGAARFSPAQLIMAATVLRRGWKSKRRR